MHDELTLSTAQLNAMGLDRRAINALVATGTLKRLRRGYFAFGEVQDELDHHRRLIAASVDHANGDNIVSHVSAAVLHGLPVSTVALTRATMTRRSKGHTTTSPQLMIRNTVLTDEEVVQLGEYRVTSLPRTVADLARTSPFMWGVAAADHALHTGGTTHDELFVAVGRHPGLSGIVRARQVVGFADERAESPAESISRSNMRLAGLPAPTTQPEFFDDNGEFIARTDFFWKDFAVVGECDGISKYTHLRPADKTLEDVLREEKEREMRLRALGLWVVRWGWPEALSPQKLRTVLAPALFGSRETRIRHA